MKDFDKYLEILLTDTENKLISVSDLIFYLSENQKYYWDNIFIFVEKVATFVTNDYKISYHNKDLIKDEVASLTFELLKKKIQTETSPKFNDKEHFKNYIFRICRNIIKEKRREFNSKNNSIQLENAENLLEYEIPDYFLDLNIFDTETMEKALCIILVDKTQPYFSHLVKGIEEKVEILMLKVVEGKSYTEILTEKYGIKLNFFEENRILQNIRQDVCRVKEELVKRMQLLIKNQCYENL